MTVEAGRGVEAPFTVFPPKQIWLGRPKDRSIRVTAAPVGVEQPPPPLPGTYRQKSWLPWWLAVVAPIAAAIVAAVILLAPKQTVVPNLTKAQSVFEAQKMLIPLGLKLQPQPALEAVRGRAARRDRRPGAGRRHEGQEGHVGAGHRRGRRREDGQGAERRRAHARDRRHDVARGRA